MHLRPEGVIQLSMRRRMEKARATSTQMTVAQLRQELDEASKREIEYGHYFEETVEHIAGLEAELSRYKDDLEETQGKLRKNEYQLKSFKTQLGATGNGGAFNPEVLLELATRREDPSPVDCIKIIEDLYGDRCTVLDSAWNSARKTTHFIYGRDLLDLLVRLVTTYRAGLIDGGDSKARQVFGRYEYAAKESKTVMENKAMRRQRTFEYNGTQVEMFRHLKIGVDDDKTRTIRVYFGAYIRNSRNGVENSLAPPPIPGPVDPADIDRGQHCVRNLFHGGVHAEYLFLFGLGRLVVSSDQFHGFGFALFGHCVGNYARIRWRPCGRPGATLLSTVGGRGGSCVLASTLAG